MMLYERVNKEEEKEMNIDIPEALMKVLDKEKE